MSKQEVNVTFDYDFSGRLEAERGQVNLGMAEGGLRPYDLLLGALASCLYATFLEIAQKKKIAFDSVDIKVTGVKREEVPTTLKDTKVVMTVKGAQETGHKGLTRAMDLAAKYCSVFQTISQVSEMAYEIHFD